MPRCTFSIGVLTPLLGCFLVVFGLPAAVVFWLLLVSRVPSGVWTDMVRWSPGGGFPLPSGVVMSLCRHGWPLEAWGLGC